MYDSNSYKEPFKIETPKVRNRRRNRVEVEKDSLKSEEVVNKVFDTPSFLMKLIILNMIQIKFIYSFCYLSKMYYFEYFWFEEKSLSLKNYTIRIKFALNLYKNKK